MWRLLRCASLVICFAALPLLSDPAWGGASIPELLGALELSDYPPGWRPPAITAKTLDGNGVTLEELKGRVILVNFWATWCVPCLHEMPAFERLHRDYEGSGLSLLGVNIQEDRQTIERYATRLALTFTLLSDGDGGMTKAYGVVGMPTSFLIARDGRPVALAVGDREWDSPPARRLIEALLAEPPTGVPAG